MTSKTQELIDNLTKYGSVLTNQSLNYDEIKSLKADLEKCEEDSKKYNCKHRWIEDIDESKCGVCGETSSIEHQFNNLEQNQRTKQDEENAKLRENLKRHLIHINDFIEEHDTGHHTSSFTVIDVALHEKTAIEKLLEESKI